MLGIEVFILVKYAKHLSSLFLLNILNIKYPKIEISY